MKKRKLLYIGNALSKHDKTPTTADTLPPRLKALEYEVTVASSKRVKVLRLLDMIMTTIRFRKRVDVVCIDAYSTANFLYLRIISRLCRFFDLDYIPILHGGNLPSRLEKQPNICNRIFGKAVCNVAPSLYLQEIFTNAGFSNTVHIPNTIDIEKYPFKKRLSFAPKLLWVRSFASIYNPMMAVRVLQDLLKDYPEATLTMVGPEKDESYEECYAFAKAYNLPITFTGALSLEQWTALAENHDVFISTTNFDNMPVSIIEAMALGLPVVSTDVGGMPYLITHHIDGILSPPSDVPMFVENVKRVFNNSDYSTLIAEKARQKAETYHWDEVKIEWQKVLS